MISIAGLSSLKSVVVMNRKGAQHAVPPEMRTQTEERNQLK